MVRFVTDSAPIVAELKCVTSEVGHHCVGSKNDFRVNVIRNVPVSWHSHTVKPGVPPTHGHLDTGAQSWCADGGNI
jgi:hypothetical protein